MTVVDDLRSLSIGDLIEVTAPDGETYRLIVSGRPEYEPPDNYGAGYVSVIVEVDTDAHEVPSDVFPSETGDLSSDSDYHTHEFSTPTLDIWNPITDDDGEIVSDEFVQVCDVASLSVLDE